jgi:hypothetical protein
VLINSGISPLRPVLVAGCGNGVKQGHFFEILRGSSFSGEDFVHLPRGLPKLVCKLRAVRYSGQSPMSRQSK